MSAIVARKADMITDDQSHAPYYKLRLAMEKFQKGPDELEPAQREWLDTTVANQWQMESNVLATDEAQSVTVPTETLTTAVQAVREKYDSEGVFKQDLAKLGLDRAGLKALLERQLKVEAVLDKCTVGVSASEAQAKEFFEKNPDKFQQPEKRQAWHLLITINDEYKENNRDSVIERLSNIRKETAGDLTLFKERVKRYSECPSTLSEGELGWIPKGHLFPQIDEALFKLDKNEITPIIETEVGFHLVYCSEIKPAGMPTFDEVKEQLINKLTELAKRKAQKQWLDKLN